ncbi:hypothetical protein CEXT_811041 [Caerostris extrusa]|uniref:Uncharacterized protein n=1 Tax=Caerostris extrusa TaxID=172846 RepID=A0AAV4RJ71_CAEEX|nr:hypothetical protein CEXT_811041 [Caerostris extrusa]
MRAVQIQKHFRSFKLQCINTTLLQEGHEALASLVGSRTEISQFRNPIHHPQFSLAIEVGKHLFKSITPGTARGIGLACRVLKQVSAISKNF